MNKNMKLSVVISIGLGMGFFLNPSFALQESQPTPPAKIEVPLDKPSVALPEKLSPEIDLLKETVGQYFTAWNKKDFNTMRSFEDWTGGKALNDVEYIQSFKANFTIHTWKITKVSPLDDDRYQVLILIAHNVPENMLAYLPKGNKTVRSTLPKLWKKQGDKFVHLFHIEHQKIMDAFPKEPLMQSPLSPEQFSAPTTPEPKLTPKTPESN